MKNRARKEYLAVVWDDAKKEKLLDCLKKGFSYSKIAEYFGVSYDSIDGVIKRMRCLPQFRGRVPYVKNTIPTMYSDKVGIIDIEVSNLHSNRGFLLTYVIKKYGKPQYYKSVINPADLRRGLYDKNLVSQLVEDMKNFDVLIGYFSSGFDIPFIRGRAVFHNIPFPHFGTIRHLDLFYRVKYKYGLSRNSLEAACRMCGIKGKTHLDLSMWLDAATFGDEKSLNYILQHNIADVQITEKLYDRIKDYSKETYKSI